uniref:replication protein n=1 Tax=Caloranaerobacter sp. DY30410 TaxID=3238305 RepID=UPI003CFFE3CF
MKNIPKVGDLMANPQVEDGFTKIANELLEVIYRVKFNATQLKILLFVMRYTYGFSRKEHELSINFISKGINVSKRYVTSELNKLIEMKVILVVKEHTDTSSRVLKLNKNYDEWLVRGIEVQQVKNSSTGEEKHNTPDEELFNTPDEELFTQENKNINKNINKRSSSISRTIIQQVNNSSSVDNIFSAEEEITTTSEGSTKIDSNISKIALEYQKCGFGQINWKVKELLEDLLEQYPVEWIIKAFEICVDQNKRKLSYARGILQ